ncbi:unnamed protein product [Rotaria sp. Silwood2]|nr:unnamed protein product [Rotaria sp. Silwood2]CAF4368384.1 unnamed protein product [Rotaria sp. Silwood2]
MASAGNVNCLAVNRQSIRNKSPSTVDAYYGKSFFDDENYQSILECLDGGKRWTSKVQQQPLISSYNKTKDVQLNIIRTPERYAELIEARFEKIRDIITTYTREMQRIYPRTRLRFTRKHYKTDEMRSLFQSAYSSLFYILNKLEQLREQKKLAENALCLAGYQCENKIENAEDNYRKQEKQLKVIKEQIVQTKDECNQEKILYRKKATQIYEECRALEKERLDLMRETLIKFIKEAFSFENVTQQRQIYEDLSSMLQIQQNSSQDLDFWAQAYGVFDSRTSLLSANNQRNDNDCNERISNQTASRKPKKSQECETLNLTTTEIFVNESRIEDDK